MCICLDFLKPKTRINKKVDKKMCLAEPKTQLFKKSCILGSGKMQVRNALNLWTSEVHKSKRVAGILDIITVGRCIYVNAPNISHKLTQTHQFSHTPHALTPMPPSLACISALCSVVSFFLFFFFLPLSYSTRF